MMKKRRSPRKRASFFPCDAAAVAPHFLEQDPLEQHLDIQQRTICTISIEKMLSQTN
jgi:hypothetical protein